MVCSAPLTRSTPAHLQDAMLLIALLAVGGGCAGAHAENRAAGDSTRALGVGFAQPVPSCHATALSLTPAAWSTPVPAPPATAPRGPLRLVADVPLPGPANRFDYQSIDAVRGRLYISHMDAGRVLVFDLDSARVVADIAGTPRVTGILAVPVRHTIYASAAGAHQVVAIDDRTLAITARVSGIRFPDGIAYAPSEEKLFVSDESGAADVVIDARANARRRTIPLGGEAGNTHYDSVSHCILVAVQTRNQLVAIDPATERVVQRYDLPGSDHPHGFVLDQVGRLAFITGEGNAQLLVLDLRTMRVLATRAVGGDPDVLAWDPGWRRLYVASESGRVTELAAAGSSLELLGELRLPHAHTVAVDPRTHRVYLPLENMNGRPVLRILTPGASPAGSTPGAAPAQARTTATPAARPRSPR